MSQRVDYGQVQYRIETEEAYTLGDQVHFKVIPSIPNIFYAQVSAKSQVDP